MQKVLKTMVQNDKKLIAELCVCVCKEWLQINQTALNKKIKKQTDCLSTYFD